LVIFDVIIHVIHINPVLSYLPKMKLPSCIIWGKNDNVTPPEVANEFHKLLPNSDLFWIDKCGHAPMMEHPGKFNTILVDWLTSKITVK